MRPLGSGVARASAALPRRPLLSNNPTRGNLVLSLSVILLVACAPGGCVERSSEYAHFRGVRSAELFMVAMRHS